MPDFKADCMNRDWFPETYTTEGGDYNDQPFMIHVLTCM